MQYNQCNDNKIIHMFTSHTNPFSFPIDWFKKKKANVSSAEAALLPSTWLTSQSAFQTDYTLGYLWSEARRDLMNSSVPLRPRWVSMPRSAIKLSSLITLVAPGIACNCALNKVDNWPQQFRVICISTVMHQ